MPALRHQRPLTGGREGELASVTVTDSNAIGIQSKRHRLRLESWPLSDAVAALAWCSISAYGLLSQSRFHAQSRTGERGGAFIFFFGIQPLSLMSSSTCTMFSRSCSKENLPSPAYTMRDTPGAW